MPVTGRTGTVSGVVVETTRTSSRSSVVQVETCSSVAKLGEVLRTEKGSFDYRVNPHCYKGRDHKGRHNARVNGRVFSWFSGSGSLPLSREA